MLPAQIDRKKAKVGKVDATLAYGPECLMIPQPTRKKAVEAKRGMYLRVSRSFCGKDFPFIRFSG